MQLFTQLFLKYYFKNCRHSKTKKVTEVTKVMTKIKYPTHYINKYKCVIYFFS